MPVAARVHRQLTAVAKEDVVAQERVVGRVADRGGSLQAAVEPRDPTRARGPYRPCHELIAGEREHDVNFTSGGEDRLGPEDVGTAGQGAVRETDLQRPHRAVDPFGDRAFSGRREARRVDPVPAEVNHRRSGERREERVVDFQQVADQSQLLAGCRQRPVVAVVQSRGAVERVGGCARLAAQEVGLGPRGRGVIGVAAVGHQAEDRVGQRARPRAVAGNEPQGGGVDRWVVAAGPGEDRVVEGGGLGGEATALAAVCGERHVLGQSRAQGADVLVGNVLEAVGLEAAPGFIGGARACQCEDCSMFQTEIGRVSPSPRSASPTPRSPDRAPVPGLRRATTRRLRLLIGR